VPVASSAVTPAEGENADEDHEDDEDDVEDGVTLDGQLTAILLNALSDEARALLVEENGDFDIEAAFSVLQVSADSDADAAKAVRLIEEQHTIAQTGRGKRRKQTSVRILPPVSAAAHAGMTASH
jgi:hypothetical protein